jgi:transcriptional regulator with XRE-family HTH domain
MGRKTTSSLRELVRKLEKEPSFRAERRRQRPYFDLILEVIRARKRLGITQEELAARAGMQQSAISRIESGEHDIQFKTLIQLAEGLDSTIEIKIVPNVAEDEYEKLADVSLTKGGPSQSYDETPTEPLVVSVRE